MRADYLDFQHFPRYDGHGKEKDGEGGRSTGTMTSSARRMIKEKSLLDQSELVFPSPRRNHRRCNGIEIEVDCPCDSDEEWRSIGRKFAP